MTARRRPSSAAALAWAFALLGMAWGGYLGARQIAGSGSLLDRVEYLTLDWRVLLAGARPSPRGVVIAAIDDETLREVGTYPLPRDMLARILRALSGYRPQAIALDMLFLDPGPADADAALAEALRTGPAVVGAVGVFGAAPPASGTVRDLAHGELIPAPETVQWPIAAVQDAARSGLVNLSTDEGGVPRFVPMMFRTGDRLVPSFALAAASAALNTEPVLASGAVRLAARSVPLDLGFHLPIRYYGPRGTVRRFSLARVLHRDLDPDLVRGQVVIVGATALATGDTFAVPFDRVVPGVEILATAVSNLLAGDGLVRTDRVRRIDAASAIVLPPLLVVLLGLRRAAIGAALAAAVLAAWLAAVYAAFLAGYWLSVAVPLAAAVPAAASYGLARLAADRASAQRLGREKQALAKFQSPALVDRILADPGFLVRPVEQDAAVVFLDLSRFTGVAEALGPRWARDLLADFHARIEGEVVAHGGYVAAFMGDGAMIVFGLPSARQDDASQALRAIAGLRETVGAWIASLPPVARERLGLRVGGHFGPLVLSRLGAAEHQHVTATGDTVNVTSRLLELAKEQSSGIVVTEELWNAAAVSARERWSARPPVEVAVRGRVQPLRIRVLEPNRAGGQAGSRLDPIDSVAAPRPAELMGLEPTPPAIR